MHPESSKHASFMAVTMILLFFFTFPLNTNQTSTDNTTFSFSTFSLGMPGINCTGDAVLTDQTIFLTKSLSKLTSDGTGRSAGRAAYFKQFHLWDNASSHVADFNTHFSFVIDSENNNTKGSGMTFFLASDFDRLPSLSSLLGEFLGLSSDQTSHTGSARYVAVEFDTAVSQIDTADREHIGIDINSMNSSIYVEWSKNDIYNGGRIEAWIEYDSSSNNLSFLVKNGDTEYYTSENSYSSFYIVNLTEHLTEWVTFGFTAATTIDNFELHRIYSWEFHSSLKLEESTLTNHTDMPKRKNRGSLWAFLATGCALLFVLFLGLVCFGYWRTKRRRQQREGSKPVSCTNQEFEKETGPRSFSYEELVVATNNFAKDRILGKGGFGMVYMGFWSNRDSCIAVKKIISESEDGLKAYASEVTIISRLRHRNLVQLLGWCRNKQELLIVYDFMPNKSLDFHLFNKTGLLTWNKRYGVALGLASGLLYLHEECEQCVLHRDIKSSNVLLDSNLNAKLGDFGLARLVEHGQSSDTTKLIGTIGYVSLEYLESGKATKESDVYSFGIVALEIASGRPAIFKEHDGNYGTKSKVKLLEWAWEYYQRGDIFGTADPQLNEDYVKEEMERLIVVGLACAHPDHSRRVSIREAIDVLNAKAPLPILPLEMPVLPNMNPSSGSSSIAITGNTQSTTSTTF